MPDAPRFAHDVREGLLEMPVTTMRLFGRNWPAGGGGYFRLMPYAVSRWLLRRVNRVDQQPAIFYFHPWEIDAGQPRVPGIDAKTRFRHYLNLHRMEHRLRQLLFDFEWGRVDEVLLERPDAPERGRRGSPHAIRRGTPKGFASDGQLGIQLLPAPSRRSGSLRQSEPDA